MTGTSGYREPRVTRLAREFTLLARDLARRPVVAREAVTDHLQRSAASIVTNAGEGLGEPSRRDKRRFFRYAYRSAAECEQAIRALAAISAITPAEASRALRLLKDIKLDLRRLLLALSRRRC